MKIIITVNKDETQVAFDGDGTPYDNGVTYDDLISTLLTVMEQATRQFMKKAKCTKEGREHLYDVLDSLFFTFMERTFPDIQPRDFDFSDAAILYAQDKIIDEAEKKGITFDEAMEKYEKRAKEYVRQKREGYIQ